jgi:hypothetical protein
VFFEVLNRLFGGKDQSIDAVNAYIEGNASVDETQLVEKMMREDSSLEKDLSTQTALLSVLGRIDQLEAPRSFAISPEMVAAAERSESQLSRFAELFAPHRKLALTPAVIAGIATLSVALLTLGDLTGVVDQSTSNKSISISTSAVSESAASDGTTTPSLSFAQDSAAAAPRAATQAMAAALAPEADSADDAAEGTGIAPPSLAMEAPLAGTADEPADTTLKVAPESAVEDEATERLLPKSEEPAASSAETEQSDSDGSITIEASPDLAYSEGVLPGMAITNEGISLPLRQLQFSLAALALAAVGTSAGLRRARGE